MGVVEIDGTTLSNNKVMAVMVVEEWKEGEMTF